MEETQLPSMMFSEIARISGPMVSDPIPSSSRSRDRDRVQRISFKAEPTFSGIVHIEGSVSDPNIDGGDSIWFELASIEVYDESGTWSYEFDAELSMIRVAVYSNEYWSGVLGATGTPSTPSGGTILVDTTSINVPANSSATDVANLINSAFSGSSIFAKVIDGGLFIGRADGLPITISDVLGTTMSDFGISTQTYKNGSLIIHAKR